MKYDIPSSLNVAYNNKNLIPIVGAGVSLSIRDKNNRSIFPSWKHLLELAAEKILSEKNTKLANAIKAVLELDDYIKAADYARQGLSGRLWNQFFKDIFEVDYNSINTESLELPRSIWTLSNRVITLNYDKIMTWASPDQNVQELDNSTKAELANFCNWRNQKPYIWHLHGRIGNTSKIIFTSESYNKFYKDTNEDFRAALSILKDVLREHQILFVGCSLDDAELIQKFDEQNELFEGNVGPHYAFVLKKDAEKIKNKINTLPIELIVYENHGEQLVKLIDSITKNINSTKTTNKINAQQFILEQKPNNKKQLVELIKFCTQHNDAEISRVAKRKYIPDLYVARDIEMTLKTLLLNDNILTNQLSESVNIFYSIALESKNNLKQLSESLKKLQSSKKILLAEKQESPIQNREITKRKIVELNREIEHSNKEIERLNEIIRILAETDEHFKEILIDSLPCSGVNRPIFREVEEKLTFLMSLSAGKSLNSITKCLEVIQPASRFVTVIVDRAGGGKTNLLCHLTKINSKYEPTLFLGGRVNLTSDTSLLIQLAETLGADKNCNVNDYLSGVNRLLEKYQCHATIFIDGINENRNIKILNIALNNLFVGLQSTRFRFVISCRDIYWGFFVNSSWVKFGNIVEGNLYSFSRREQENALETYLRYFKIDVRLGPLAKERCKHPLLLRFFCEAYADNGNERVSLGNVSDIRLKPLFDDYWKVKIANRNKSLDNELSKEGAIEKFIDHFLKFNEASLTTDTIAQLTGIVDLDSEKSTYLALLDEDIIIEENPTSSIEIRKVVFVYEEFMEYVAARFLYKNHKLNSLNEIDKFFKTLDGKVKSFVNILGITEYLCAFLFDNKDLETNSELKEKEFEKKLRSAFRLIVNMARSGKSWLPIISNVFLKYDAAASMIVKISNDDMTYLAETFLPTENYVDLKGVQIILNAIGKINRSLMLEIGVLLIYSAILSKFFSFQDITSKKIPNNLNIKDDISSERNIIRANKLIKSVAKVFKEYELNSDKTSYWRPWAGNRKYVGMNDRIELIKYLPNQLTGTKRRIPILTFVCNGLRDDDIRVRQACALVTKDLNNEFALSIKNKCRNLETDIKVIDLLNPNKSNW